MSSTKIFRSFFFIRSRNVADQMYPPHKALSRPRERALIHDRSCRMIHGPPGSRADRSGQERSRGRPFGDPCSRVEGTLIPRSRPFYLRFTPPPPFLRSMSPVLLRSAQAWLARFCCPVRTSYQVGLAARGPNTTSAQGSKAAAKYQGRRMRIAMGFPRSLHDRRSTYRASTNRIALRTVPSVNTTV